MPKRVRLAMALLLLFLAGALSASGWGAYMVLKRPGPGRTSAPSQNGAILYEVPAKASVSFLAFDLYGKGFIAYPRVFKAFVRLTGREKRLRAGFYYLPPRNSVRDMAFILTSGKMATQTVTIPEGKASWEVFEILRQRFPMDSAAFDFLVNSAEFTHSLGLEAYSLEGYLFPDTYIFPYRVAADDALRAMVRRFQEVAESMAAKDSEVIRKYGLHGWVTLASIVEKEATIRGEQALIAGVFHNRLRLGWPLGADPTVRFALRKLTGPLYARELDVNSPYNTRRFSGLPPGPICSPGNRALEAVLKPEKTDMMFFVARDDGSHGHYFSVTNPDHNRYKLQAAQNRKSRKNPELQNGEISPNPDSGVTALESPH